MPINLKDYHENWKVISRSIIRDRAKNQCELCGKENGMYICYPPKYPHGWYYCAEKDKGVLAGKVVKVVLTVHHINCDTADNHPLNLIALCQRCHLRLDLARHIKNRKNKKCR